MVIVCVINPTRQMLLGMRGLAAHHLALPPRSGAALLVGLGLEVCRLPLPASRPRRSRSGISAAPRRSGVVAAAEVGLGLGLGLVCASPPCVWKPGGVARCSPGRSMGRSACMTGKSHDCNPCRVVWGAGQQSGNGTSQQTNVGASTQFRVTCSMQSPWLPIA